jgi:putative transposase
VKTRGGTDEGRTVYQRADRGHPAGGPQEAQKGEKPIRALCKDKGISEATFYTWRKRFGGMATKDVQRLRELEKENTRLKRLLAERDLELDVVREALSKNGGALPSRSVTSFALPAGAACRNGGPAAWPDNPVPWQGTGPSRGRWTKPPTKPPWWSA